MAKRTVTPSPPLLLRRAHEVQRPQSTLIYDEAQCVNLAVLDGRHVPAVTLRDSPVYRKTSSLTGPGED